ncbi:unnamed protein product [Periconia digitata]|uniref:Uncharacterized protein n=1 Tax=Periconia digitata TaxID=1303443 RepID=A0A9W4U4Q0_9PLEO|nr:unnamed protein product [Periconia digitata]
MSLGALTTQFTPAPSCLASSAYWLLRTSSTTSHEYNFFGQPLDRAEDCYPPNYNPASTAYYSPAKCPSGYSAATGTTKIISETLTETAEVCCPTIDLYRPQTTNNLNTQHPFLTTLLCEYIVRNQFLTTVTSSEVGQPTSTTTTWTMGFAINAYAVLVKRNNLDFATKTSDSSTTISTSASRTPTSNENPNAGPTSGTSTSIEPNNTNNNTQSSLGTGASIGIGVGMGILIMGLLIAIVFLVLKRRKKNKELAAILENTHKAYELPPAPLASFTPTVPLMQYRYQVEASPNELDGASARFAGARGERPMELDGHRPAELPAVYKAVYQR